MDRRRYLRFVRLAAGVLAVAGVAAPSAMPAELPASAAEVELSAATGSAATPAGSPWSAGRSSGAATSSATTTSPGVGRSSGDGRGSDTAPRTESIALAGTDSTTTGSGPTGLGCERTLNVVAHEDDDLLFVNPAVSDDIAAGRCVVTLFVTAGDAGRTRTYWHGRELGSMAAYAAMAGVPNAWVTDTLTVGGHRFTRVQLSRARITLLFLRLPDAHGNAERPLETLQRLWRDEISTIYTLDTGDVYTRAALIATLTGIMDLYQPTRIRTLDYVGKYGDGDHADHHTVGYLTYAAQRYYNSPHEIAGYMGYQVANQPENLSAGVRDAKLGYFLAYAPHDPKVCQSYGECLLNFYGPRFSHSIATATETGGGRNVALTARARASSANTAARQGPGKAIDGTAAGAPGATGHEWATLGGRAGSWLELSWDRPQRLDEVDLYDRPNQLDHITGSVLEFSDGSVVRVGPLPNGGIPKVVHFHPRTVIAVRLRVTAVSPTTRSVGLAEIRAYAALP